jgi:prepilin-type N-terminal cleavage/methylation domain-containing protein
MTEKKEKEFQRIWKNSCGFTLIEMMVTVAILSIVLYGIYELVIQQQRGYVIQEEVSEIQQDIRIALDLMASEIRRAGADVPNTTIPICPPAPACTNGVSDSITFSITNGISTFLVPNAGAGGAVADTTQVFVNNTNGFLAGVVNILRPISRTLVSAHTISGASGGGAIPLNTPVVDPSILQAGDMVVFQPFTVTYDLAGTDLRRNGVVLAENIQDLQFSYISNTGIETATPPLNSLDIRAVRITITSATMRDVSDFGGAARTRQLSTIVKTRNLEI